MDMAEAVNKYMIKHGWTDCVKFEKGHAPREYWPLLKETQSIQRRSNKGKRYHAWFYKRNDNEIALEKVISKDPIINGIPHMVNGLRFYQGESFTHLIYDDADPYKNIIHVSCHEWQDEIISRISGLKPDKHPINIVNITYQVLRKALG